MLTHARARAFTLLELVVALSILSVALGIAFVNLRTGVTSEGSRGLAYELVAELRAARSEAQQSGKFVTFTFPSDGGSNPFSRSFQIQSGYDKSNSVRTRDFDHDTRATIFAGEWGSDTQPAEPDTPLWVGSTSEGYRLIFHPDGKVSSPNLLSLDGRFSLVILSTGEASGQTLNRASNPSTVWISRAGTIGMTEKSLPLGTLPSGGQKPVIASATVPTNTNTNSEPQLVSVDFLPKKVDDIENVGLGQTYVQIHPQQTRPGQGTNGVEYGLTTFRFRAKDLDGGPLNFRISSEADRGSEHGNFSYASLDTPLGPSIEGPMDFVQTETGEWLWETQISWRPAPGSTVGTVFDFQLAVTDKDGHLMETESGTTFFPRIALLEPENVAMEVDGNKLYLTNMNGTATRKLTVTEPGTESNPFYSSDGTILYSFEDTPDELAILVRNGDGTGLKKLQSFPRSFFRRLTFDPFKTFAGYLAGSSDVADIEYEVVEQTGSYTYEEDSGGEGGTTTVTVPVYGVVTRTTQVSINQLEVMHLNSGKKVTVSDHAQPDFNWYGKPRYGLGFRELRIYDDSDRVPPGQTQHPRVIADGVAGPLPNIIPSPGYRMESSGVVIQDYPPRAVAATLPVRPAGVETQVYNLASPRFHLECANSAPCLSLVDDTGALPKSVLSSAKVTSPSWSRDGQWVYYARTDGAETKIIRRKALNATLDSHDIGSEDVLYSDTGVTSPKVTQSGDFAFFMKGGDLYRLGVNDRTTPINLTAQLPARVKSFVLSR